METFRGVTAWETLRELESVDWASVSGEAFEGLLGELAGVLAHVQALQVTVLHEAARRVLGPPGPDPTPPTKAARHADQIIGFALHLEPETIREQCAVADTLVEELPMVLAALDAGEIDLPKATAFVKGLKLVEDRVVARRIAATVLPDAGAITLKRVQARIRYQIDVEDSRQAKRRRNASIADRGVALRDNADGSATVVISKVPKQRAVAGFDRVDRLARAARAAGDPRILPQLRADAALDLLEGRPFQLAPTYDASTAEADATNPRPDDGPDDLDGPRPGNPGPGNPNNPDGPGGPGEGGPGEGGPGEGGGRGPVGPRSPSAGSGSAAAAGADGGDCDLRSWVNDPPEAHPDPSAPNPTDRDTDRDGGGSGGGGASGAGCDLRSRIGLRPGDRCVCGGLIPPQPPGVVEVVVRLSTIAHLDDHPALVPGLGTLLADAARLVAVDPVIRPVWAWSLRDEKGHLLHHGTTRHRPTPWPGPRRRATAGAGAGAESDVRSRIGAGSGADCDVRRRIASGERVCACPRVVVTARRSVIDLQLTARELAHPPKGWEMIIGDIVRQVAQQPRPEWWDERDAQGWLKTYGYTMRSFPPREAAFIRARDTTCRAPNCHRPASRCQLDHREEHARGGPSHRGCGHPLCALHHVTRHLPGVSVDRTKDGTTRWHLPNGNVHNVPYDNDIILTNDYVIVEEEADE